MHPGSGRPPPCQANVHELEDAVDEDTQEFLDATDTIEESDTLQANQHAKKNGKTLPPHDIRRVLSQSKAPPKLQVKMANFVYRVTTHKLKCRTTLIDRGANGGIAGDDV